MHLWTLTKGGYDKNTYDHCKQQIIWEGFFVSSLEVSLWIMD